jgi:CheY-like chemotaxis protein
MITNSDILGARILIVDDQHANVRMLQRLLADAGYSQVTATMLPAEV